MDRWAELAGANLGHVRGCGASGASIAGYRRQIDAERIALEARGLDVSRFDAVLDAHAARAHDDLRRLHQRSADVDAVCAGILERMRARLAARPG